MKLLYLSLLALELAWGLVEGAVVTPTRTFALRDGNSTGSSPCAQVSASASAQLLNPSASSATVDAQLAYDCLNSVPLNATAAAELIDSILPYVEWQSDLSYLKNPPSTYLMPKIDLRGELKQIKTSVSSGKYANEYAFQADLLKTFQAVHDGHTRFAPDLVSKALQFRRPVSVVSVSQDGSVVPKVYVKDDILAYNSINGTKMPSALVKVNGQDVNDFMMDLAMLGYLQDPDALYNNLMYEKAFDSQFSDYRYTGYFALAGRYGYFYPGPNTTIQYDNGTTTTYQNYAEVIGNFSAVTDGASMYEIFCTGPHIQAVPSDPNAPIQTPIPPPLPPTGTTPSYGYPTPQIISSDQQISGYYLDGSAYQDIAVLSMVSFEPGFPVEFQSVIQTLISKAQAAGKTKIIIDLSSNGGGNILSGYDAFRQFFPQTVQDGFSRLRQHKALQDMSKQVSQYSANFSTSTTNAEEFFAYESVLNYRFDLNITNGVFQTYDDKFKTQVVNGDNYTGIVRWNLDDPTLTTNPIWGVGETITGYGNRKNFTQPFPAADIILVHDGYCASTCGLFSDFMRTQGGVKSVAMGGRPNTDIIQGIGGTRGANNYGFDYIMQLATVAVGTGTPAQIASWSDITQYTDLALNRSTDASINVRDNILRDHLQDGIPAQFLYQPADCRLFYEPSMISDVTAIWKKVADVTWGGGKCVAGTLPKSTETRAERAIKSEAMKLRAKREPRMEVHKRNLLALPKSRVHNKKVPL